MIAGGWLIVSRFMHGIDWSGALLVLIAVAVASFPLLYFNYPAGHDWLYELVRVSEYKSALESGQYPPYWASHLYRGYGSPIFLFYAPLFLFFSSVVSMLFDIGLLVSTKIIILVLTAVSGLSVWVLMREILGPKDRSRDVVSRVSVYLYVLAPYMIADKFIRNAYAEFTALCLLPLVVYGVLLIRRQAMPGFLVLSVSFSLLVLAHNLISLIAAFVVLVVAVAIGFKYRNLAYLMVVMGSVFLALMMSSFFWIPALYFKEAVSIEELTLFGLDYSSQFVDLAGFFFYREFYSFGAFYSVVMLAGVYGFYYYRGVPDGRRYIGALFLFLGSIFLLLNFSVSAFAWEVVPFLKLFQFPWRMIGPLVLCVIIVFGICLSEVIKGGAVNFKAIELLVIVLGIVNASPYFSRIDGMSGEVFSVADELLSKESIKENGLPTTVFDEYLPKGESVPEKSVPPVLLPKGSVIGSYRSSSDESRIYVSFGSPRNGVVVVNKWRMPVWDIRLNNEKVVPMVSDNGTLMVPVAGGSNEMHVLLRQPYLRMVLVVVGILSLIVWGAFFCLYLLRFGKESRLPPCSLL